MLYLESFRLASADEEDTYVLSYPSKLEMMCYSHQVYPFKIFPEKGLKKLSFSPLTIFYGGNGSGKSTLLNIIAEKLMLNRNAPFNNTPYFEDYLKLCHYTEAVGRSIPRGSRIITSDDVFDFLLDIRAINEGIDERREQLFKEYDSFTDPTKPSFRMRSLDDYEELCKRNEARHKTKSAYTTRRLSQNVSGKSNGESAYAYFTQNIRENALYLLDEPENSLSPKLQQELAAFLEDSIRFYRCQFIISTHSPFLLAMKEALIYDMDHAPVVTRAWTELDNVKRFYQFFKERENEFR